MRIKLSFSACTVAPP